MSKNEQGEWYCGQCGINFDDEGKPLCDCPPVAPAQRPSAPQEPQPPAGIGHLIIDLYTLEALLDLPEGVHVHHTYPVPIEYGLGVGLILTSDTPGILPEYRRYEMPQYLHCCVEPHLDEKGKRYLRLCPLLPGKE